MLERLLDEFGCALLLDCHSMPPPDSGPSVIIGDRYGQSAAPWVTSEAVKIVTSVGFRAGVNQPFAGGHVVQRHGAPARGVHALQIEIDRRCYLQANVTKRGPGIRESRAAVRGIGAAARPVPARPPFFRGCRIKRAAPVMLGTAQFREERTIGALLAAANEGELRSGELSSRWACGGRIQFHPPRDVHASAGAGCGTVIGPFPWATCREKMSRICDSEKRCA